MLAVALVLVSVHVAAILGDGLAKSPPMGYNSWNDLECKPSEKKLKAIADKLEDLGFLDLGYEYVVIDDCWMIRRSAEGVLVEDAAAFPSGIPSFGDFLHEKGFKFGIYTDRGLSTCVGRPASRGHEAEDGSLFAEWKVDFVKNDGCKDPECGDVIEGWPESGSCPAKGKKAAVEKYLRMAKALNSSGRPVVHSICGWQPWFAPVGRKIGHMWRVTADVRDFKGVYEATRVMEQLRHHHGPHGWNDPDMLIGSSGGAELVLTEAQSRAQFTLWVVMSAPLMLGANVMKMSDFDVETYSNARAISINQDWSGDAGTVVLSTCPEYPSFTTGVEDDGMTPHFVVNWPKGQVNCGSHFAKDCTACGKEGRDQCAASCKFIAEGEPACLPRNKSKVPPASVKCGNHRAPTCAGCPQGNGRHWCHDDCYWWDAGNCVSNPKFKYEDRWYPWTVSIYQNKDWRQCQIAWTKKLSNGNVALGVVNFAQKSIKLPLSLAKLRLPWTKMSANAFDVWKGTSRNFKDSLQLKLEADGGHALLELSQPTVAEEMSEAEQGTSEAPAGSKARSVRSKSREPLMQIPASKALSKEESFAVQAVLARSPRTVLERLVEHSISEKTPVTLAQVLEAWPPALDDDFQYPTMQQEALAVVTFLILVFLCVVRRRQSERFHAN